MLKGLTASRTDSGAYVFLCAECGTVLMKAPGAPNLPERPYILICPSCDHIVGHWTTERERDKELAEYAAKHAR
jgi:hypothetical protein